MLFFKLIRLLGYHPKAENPKLSGSINPEYSGFIEEHTPDYWLEKARKNNLDLIKKRFQLTSQREALRRAKSSWLPEITGNFSIFISGEEYPLSEPGFNLGINLSFPVPVVPIQAATSVGKKNPLERYRDINVSGRIAENLESLYSVAAAKLNLSKSASELKELEKDLRFSIQEVIFNIENHKKMLALLKEKLKIEQKRIAIQELKLELGEIKRIDLIDQQIELAELKIEILTEIVSLYNQEISLLKMCGIPNLATTYKYIILEQDNKP